MKICRVVGLVVATIKHASLAGRKLLIVQPVTEDDEAVGAAQIAVDSVQAGPGEKVLLCDEGGAASLVLGREGPIRAVIVGRIDNVTMDGSSLEKGS